MKTTDFPLIFFVVWLLFFSENSAAFQQQVKAPITNGSQLETKIIGKNKTENQRALLHAARIGNLSELETLLKQGVSPDSRSKDIAGRSALIVAAIAGHVKIIKMLLESGATVDDKDNKGLSALSWAVIRGHTEVVTALLNKGADINTRDKGGVSPVLYAIGVRKLSIVNLLVTNNADLEVLSYKNKMTPLLLAVENKDLESMKILIDNGVKVNGKNQDNFTPLMAAAEKGHFESVMMLLSVGSEIDERDIKGLTALNYAADKQHFKTIKLLLAKGANLNTKDVNARTPLTRATLQGYHQVINILQDNALKNN